MCSAALDNEGEFSAWSGRPDHDQPLDNAEFEALHTFVAKSCDPHVVQQSKEEVLTAERDRHGLQQALQQAERPG